MDFEKTAADIADMVRTQVLDWHSLESHGHNQMHRLQQAIADALRDSAGMAKKAPPGHIIDEHGYERRVLGTLPLTADGCVAAPKMNTWRRCADKSIVALGVLSIEINDSGHPSDIHESERWLVLVRDGDGDEYKVFLGDCYSTREAAEAASEKGGER